MTEPDADRAAKILEEMRDLQREHVTLYTQALKNQEDALRIQRELQITASRRLRFIPALIVFVLVLIVVVLGMLMRQIG